MANKPEQVKHKIIDGKIGKYYSRTASLSRHSLRMIRYLLAKYVESVAKKLGGKIDVVEYTFVSERGEGVEKKERTSLTSCGNDKVIFLT